MIPDWNLLEWFGVVFLAITGLVLGLVVTYCAENLWNQWQDARHARRDWADETRREWQNYEADQALRDWKEGQL